MRQGAEGPFRDDEGDVQRAADGEGPAERGRRVYVAVAVAVVTVVGVRVAVMVVVAVVVIVIVGMAVPVAVVVVVSCRHAAIGHLPRVHAPAPVRRLWFPRAAAGVPAEPPSYPPGPAAQVQCGPMIPLGDSIRPRRRPVACIALLLAMAACWVFVQGAGLDDRTLAASVCNLGMVAGELTHRAHLGTAVPIGPGMACVVDADRINWLTPLTSMFLHGGWMHLLGNALFFWVFGRNVEDAMGRSRFVLFYLLCGLAAAAAQVAANPASPVPMVGASGAISGVMGAYLLLYPSARIRMLFVILIVRVPAWLVLLYWFGLQVVAALPQLAGAQQAVESGVAVMAHVAGFITGIILVRAFVRWPHARRQQGWL